MPGGIKADVKTYQMFINGEWVTSQSAKTFPVYDPSTEEVIAQVPDANAEDVSRAVTAAKTAFEEGPWPRMSGMERAEVLAFKSGRDKVLEAARATVQEWLIRVFNEHQYQPTMFGLNWGRSLGTVDDRAEIARTLREAVTGLIVWDLAADRDRAELLGAWGGLAT